MPAELATGWVLLWCACREWWVLQSSVSMGLPPPGPPGRALRKEVGEEEARQPLLALEQVGRSHIACLGALMASL